LNSFAIQSIPKAGADIHIWNDYVLSWAISRDFLDIVKYLVNEDNFYTWNKEVLQSFIENKNGHLEIINYLKYLSIKILYMRINACYKIQKWFRQYLIKKYNPNSNHVKNDIKPRFESMQI